MDEDTFAIYTTLSAQTGDGQEAAEAPPGAARVREGAGGYASAQQGGPNGLGPEQARAINEIFLRFPDYLWDEQQTARLRAELYKMLRPIVGPEKMITTANALLMLKRV